MQGTPRPAPPALLRGIDRSAFAVAFVLRLRTRGVGVGFSGAEHLARALNVRMPRSRSELYWTARVCLVQRHADLAVFDRVFAAVFDDAVLELDPNARRDALPSSGTDTEAPQEHPAAAAERAAAPAALPWVTRPPDLTATDDADDSELAVPELLPSRLRGLADVPFEQLDDEQTAQLGDWLARAAASWPTRRSRRNAASQRGARIALRPTLVRARRTGWEPVELVRSRPLDVPRRLVMLCDVSASMQAQATAYLHLMRALAVQRDAEVFAFATGLTRLTTALGHRSAQAAVEQASAKVTDRFGGTRIATNVQALLSSHHGESVRGAVVLIGSDGWDADPPAQLAAAMARLRRRAYRVVWMNPRAAAPGFEPQVASMAAALEYCDQLLPAHTFASLAAVIAAVATPARRVNSRASRGWTGGTARP